MSFIALLTGALLWLVGLSLRRGIFTSYRAHRRSWEYWWPYAAFTFGGLGTLSTFGFVTATADQVALLRMAPLVILGLPMVAQSLLRGARITGSGFFLLLLFSIFGAFTLAGDAFLMPLSSLLILLPGMITPSAGYSSSALRAGTADAVRAFILILALLTVLMPHELLGPCRFDKCSIWGEALGAVGTGNALGLYLAAMGPITLLSSRGRYAGMLVIAGSFVLVDLTSSRSAIGTWLAGIVLALAYTASVKYSARWIIGAATACTAVAVAVMPFLNWNAGQFTGRVELWRRALDIVADDPLFGFGPSFWVGQDRTNTFTGNYATHNLFTEILVSSGVVGLTFLTLAVMLAIRRKSGLLLSQYVLAIVGVWLAISITEVVSAPGRTYLVPGIFAFIFMTSHATARTVKTDESEATRLGTPASAVRRR
ncbi:O-antigen ligase family protein [Cryobacterium tepidiphilum]|uniref:O-antigen ligase domain-containing protein n=1 Tax=Cryobacterium tepidiphilum TaxID=2486026 RepID=A0A3M8LAR2_9MICO|nr:O-antigen ligase family protein [Cryobacterium tepidiphilum]RNE62597.1 O-antigen ligase domain-containing protein [Cryobacterium tepidiphilum]